MRIRASSSVGVVIVGLLPAIVGGPVLAALASVIGVLAYFEYRSLGIRLTGPGTIATTGYAVVVALSFAPLLDRGARLPLLVVVLAVAMPLATALLKPTETAIFAGWAIAATGSLYVGMAMYGAVALRTTEGTVDAAWLSTVADVASPGWDGSPRGLAWLLIAIVATWLGDTSAYLVGRRWGRRPLLPHVSPKKTVEGSLAGLAGSVVTGVVGAVVFGLGIGVWIGALVGLLLGLVGQFGDLAESLLKRRAGVKDSGDLIPGHGGVLDRIDAMLFALPTGWFLASWIDRTIG